MTIHRINPCHRWSDITIFNQVAHFVEVPEADMTADIRGQVQQILSQAEARLALIGSDRSQILTVTIYLTDFANVEALNAIWDTWFPEGCAPSRACVKVELVDPQMLVEMAFTAVAGDMYKA
jgi:enamine deaminase RidA (YjgF/YER057c/UK114 family)